MDVKHLTSNTLPSLLEISKDKIYSSSKNLSIK